MSAPETLRAFLARRRQELENQLTAARGTVAAIEYQLMEIDGAEKALPPVASMFSHPPNALDAIPPANSNALLETPFTSVPFPGAMPLGRALMGPFDHMTIKQLVMRALRDHHPNGLSTSALRNFIHDAYGRSIEGNSLRPQLFRLKAENWIEGSPTRTWHLTKMAARLPNDESMNIADEPPAESLLEIIRRRNRSEGEKD